MFQWMHLLFKEKKTVCWMYWKMTDEDTPDSNLMNDSLRKEVQRALSTLTQREA